MFSVWTPVLAFSLLEVLVLIIVLAIIAALVVAVGKAGSDKLTSLTIDNLVKGECASSTTTKQGEFAINLAEIEHGVLDKLTQGFSLELFKAKVKWRKKGNTCVYTIEVTGSPAGHAVTRESDEITLKSCP